MEYRIYLPCAKKRSLRIVLTAFFILSLLQLRAQTSIGSLHVFHITNAYARPGETILIVGAGFDKLLKASLARIPEQQPDFSNPRFVYAPQPDRSNQQEDRVITEYPSLQFYPATMWQANNQSVKIVVPQRLKAGIYLLRLTDQDGKNSFYLLNQPRVQWIMTREGASVVAGSILRLQGRNLACNPKNGRVLLKNKQQTIMIPVDSVYDAYSIRCRVPDAVPPGQYELYYHNGNGNNLAWSKPLVVHVEKRSEPRWLQHRINVKDFGAVGDGLHDETAAFRDALDAIGKKGGGTLFVPDGRYQLTGELILDPNTLIEGASAARTQLFWNPLNWPVNQMPVSLISGTHDFGLKDLNIWATRAWGVILSTGPVEEQGNILLENLIVRQSGAVSGGMYMVKANRDQMEKEFNSRWNRTGLVLHGHLQIRNCDFNIAGMYTFSDASGWIRNSKFTRFGTGINQPYMAIHPKGLIFEDCFKTADGYGYAATIDESTNLYEARNHIPYDYTNDRECMTLDGGGGAYTGTIAGIRSRTCWLPPEAKTTNWTPDKWKGGGVFILSGKGAGQFRRIAGHGKDTILLDTPFEINPDSSSIISITTVRTNLYFINNRVEDAGAYQFYGSAQDCVIDGLEMKRSGGIVSRGSSLYGGRQPNWYIEVLNCRLTEGNYSHWYGIDDRGHSGYQKIEVIGTGGPGMNRGTLVRGNQLDDFSYITTAPGRDPESIVDLVIEGNHFKKAKMAIEMGGDGISTKHALIHNNIYKSVEKRLHTHSNTLLKSVLVTETAEPGKKNENTSP
ncbi:glycoside hydrolase family 55 protein [Niabella sp. CC-SYL272]|uniref:glycoside hydrolase family 55 protein n=1 Tax=Niabella agricola TaxID=2891571 RepID=UPI001F332D67|nr:glycoside hydrolase family 55 protein [Niabella agricola]MCF3111250.1 glycoside hydrolase family 55 protein [Niabella agricola]